MLDCVLPVASGGRGVTLARSRHSSRSARTAAITCLGDWPAAVAAPRRSTSVTERMGPAGRQRTGGARNPDRAGNPTGLVQRRFPGKHSLMVGETQTERDTRAGRTHRREAGRFEHAGTAGVPCVRHHEYPFCRMQVLEHPTPDFLRLLHGPLPCANGLFRTPARSLPSRRTEYQSPSKIPVAMPSILTVFLRFQYSTTPSRPIRS